MDNFNINQIHPRIFYAKFNDVETMLLSTFRVNDAKLEHKNEYENYPQYIKKYMEKFTISGYCIYGKDFRLFMRKFKHKAMTTEELEFTHKLLLSMGQSGINMSSKFTVIVCFNNENSIVFNHEMAHCMFYVDYKYRMKVIRLFKKIKPDVREKMFNDLTANEYRFKSAEDSDFVDEVNSRLSTEKLLKKGFSKHIRMTKKEVNKFKKLYQDNLKKQ